MLAKLETTYLGILRVVILIVATVALLVAGLALVSAVPPMVRKLTADPAAKVPQPSLADFIEEKKLEGTTSSQPKGNSEFTRQVETDVKEAAFNLERYLHGRSAIGEADWENLIHKGGNDIPALHISDYYGSVRKLTDQLLAAKGKPLTLERVSDLMQWHQQRFITESNQREAQQVADTAKSYYTLLLAAGAFLFFVLIVFIFLFVKIERSLRLVQTVRVGHVVDTND